MSFADYSTNPALNVTIGGKNVAEGCPPGNINDAIRQLAADGKTLNNTVLAIDLSGYATLAGPAFTAQPTYSGRGALLLHNNAANASGRIFVQAEAAAVPTMSDGDILLTY